VTDPKVVAVADAARAVAGTADEDARAAALISELTRRGYVVKSSSEPTQLEVEQDAARVVMRIMAGFGIFAIVLVALLIVAGALGLHWG
jgi:hypothetical protein